jgi:hypothetical protein
MTPEPIYFHRSFIYQALAQHYIEVTNWQVVKAKADAELAKNKAVELDLSSVPK